MGTKRTTAANSKPTAKRKPTPASWRKGQSGNPKGAPKRGESWAEIWKRIGNMTGPEVAAYGLQLAKQLRELPSNVSLKEIVVTRTFISLINEPTPGLLNAAQDREEGTPRQTMVLEGSDEKPFAFRVVETSAIRTAVGIAPAARRSADDPDAPGAD